MLNRMIVTTLRTHKEISSDFALGADVPDARRGDKAMRGHRCAEISEIISLRVLIAAAFALFAGCGATVKHEVEVKPVHITLDVNVKVQQELNEFFAFEDELKKAASEKEAKGKE
jgi:hypothetical protein